MTTSARHRAKQKKEDEMVPAESKEVKELLLNWLCHLEDYIKTQRDFIESYDNNQFWYEDRQVLDYVQRSLRIRKTVP